MIAQPFVGCVEYHLTVHCVNHINFNSDFYVSHLSFGQQVVSGINLKELREKYEKLLT